MPEVALTVEGLFAGYVPDLPILRDVSIQAETGRVTVIIGPNGAGKSTLIKAIAGLVPVSRGTVHFNGKNVTHIQPERMTASGMAYIPQSDNIFRTLSVRQNLDLALRREGRNATHQFNKLVDQFPVLGDKLDDKAGGLSGGQRQILAVAMALATQPRLLLMDEPSAGLSPKAAQDVLALTRRLCDSGVSIILVEQNVGQALRLAHHCYILAEGQNQVDGSATELLNNSIVADIYLGGKRLKAEA